MTFSQQGKEKLKYTLSCCEGFSLLKVRKLLCNELKGDTVILTLSGGSKKDFMKYKKTMKGELLMTLCTP